MPVKMTIKTAAIAAAVALAAPAVATGQGLPPPPIADLPLYAGYGAPPPPPGNLVAPEIYGEIVCMDCGAVLTAPLAPPQIALLAGD